LYAPAHFALRALQRQLLRHLTGRRLSRQTQKGRAPRRGLFASAIEFPEYPGEPRQATRRLSAADLPERRAAPDFEGDILSSRRVPRPARSTALMCTNTSLPPSSGWMKPKPLVALNHFTVPMLTGSPFSDNTMSKPTLAGWLDRIFGRVVSVSEPAIPVDANVVRPKID